MEDAPSRRRAQAAATPPGPAASPEQQAYFESLHAGTMRAYAIAKRARRMGRDPSVEVEIPLAEDLAMRVEKQVGPEGVAQRIRDATKEIGNREIVSLQVSSEVAADLLKRGEKKEACLDQAVRTGLSILTEGVLVAPLEGIAEVRIGANSDGTDYVDLYFAGPIRAAGGTGQAMSVLIADVVRRELGIGTYLPTDSEIERYKEEIPAYKQQANLQYTPTGPEIELIARNCPVCINGEGTEQEEVAGNRDLPRVESNRLRGGACLVLAEGLVLKAPKLLKHVDKLGLEGWEFLGEFIKKGKKDEPADGEEGDAPAEPAIPDIPPNPKFVRDIIAGRPVFSHPSRKGGFRLRYGRSRTGGLASTSVHPATMTVVDDFLAVGTQLKVERPGKGTLATPCDELAPPTVLLRNGSFVPLHTVEEVKEYRPAIQEIVDLGEMLVPFGEFAENNANLPHASYVWEWWTQEHEAATGEIDAHPEGSLSGREMVALAERTGVPLHPDGTLFWHDVEPVALREQGETLLGLGRWSPDADCLELPHDAAENAGLLRFLQDLGVTYRTHHLADVEEGWMQVEPRLSYPLLRGLGLDVDDAGAIASTARRSVLYDPCQPDFTTRFPTVELAERLSGFRLRPRAPACIGGRMGRPEKADVRKMSPPPHGLFPIGQAGGNQRLIPDAAALGSQELELGDRRCTACGRTHWRTFCDCGGHTEYQEPRAKEGFEKHLVTVDIKGELSRVLQKMSMNRPPDPLKGVVGVINREKVPEPLEKGVLRAKHGLWVFKDGTVRYDMTDVPITHFRPREIHATASQLNALGYTHDVHGAPLEEDEQLVELRVQDIIVSRGCMEYFLATARFVDELLQRFYDLEPFYKAEDTSDLIGALAIGLAPHTSGGALCRIIGWTRSQVHFGHPYFHAAKRRNCDGDEDAVMLLLDGLLNFSRHYVPDRRGGLMDLPLVLTTRLDPNEVDKEAHNVDTLARYPLAFYEATTQHAHPKDVGKMMGLVEDRVGKPEQYEGFGFTHDTRDIAEGPAASAYKVLESMMDKMTAQMELGRKLRAVDEADVGAKVIGTHFLPDLMGNLKAFSKQKVRCPQCNAKYRRMPLKGVCLQCGNPKLTLTVHEGSVKKYLNISKEIADRYNIDPYTKQRILLLEQSVDSLFNNDKVKKAKLSDFL
ncbi:MAG: DNA polymerase II large subunit [Thermoplasmatota archaeon]